MIENIQKTKGGGHQSQDWAEQLSTTENVIFIEDVLNAIAKVECLKNSLQSTSRKPVVDYCTLPERVADAFLNDWSCKA